MVWTLRRKRDPADEIVKWKARLCAGGHRQVYGDTYWSTFAPVVSWTTIRCIFVLALLLGWHMRSIDFIMAYTQAKVKTDIFMTLPKGTTILNVDPSKHLLQLRQNLYGLKDGQVPGMSTSRRCSKNADSYPPKWILAFSPKGLCCWFCTLTMPPSSPQVSKQLTMKLLP